MDRIMDRITDWNLIRIANQEKAAALIEKHHALRNKLKDRRKEYDESDDLHKPHLEVYYSLDIRLIQDQLTFCHNEIMDLINN